jgi:hypothetical protein
MNFKLKMTEAAFLALLSFAGIFSVGYGYGNLHASRVSLIQQQHNRDVCPAPQDVAKSIKKPAS